MSRLNRSNQASARKTWPWIVAALAAILLAGFFLILRATSAPTTASSPTCRLAQPSMGTYEAESSGVRVVTKGYSRVGSKVSMGAVLTNTTNKIAYRTLTTFDALDSAGRTVIDSENQLFRTQVIPVMLPGDSLAVGLSNALNDDVTRTGRARISSIIVTVSVGRWLTEGDEWSGFGRVSATVVAGSGVREPNGSGSLRFDVESSNCEIGPYNVRGGLVSRGASAVFRDASGSVIGGSLDFLPDQEACKPGKRTALRFSIAQTDIPANADLDRTSITAYCDFERPTGRPASGAPYN